MDLWTVYIRAAKSWTTVRQYAGSRKEQTLGPWNYIDKASHNSSKPISLETLRQGNGDADERYDAAMPVLCRALDAPDHQDMVNPESAHMLCHPSSNSICQTVVLKSPSKTLSNRVAYQ